MDGVKSGTWRIVVGEDAKLMDRMVRAEPERAYNDDEFMLRFQRENEKYLNGGFALFTMVEDNELEINGQGPALKSKMSIVV